MSEFAAPELPDLPTRAHVRAVNGDPIRQSSIMLVDDEEITLDTLQIFLEDAGYERFVLTADAREAIPTLERERPDIVLLDLMMPHVNGFEILAYIRSNEHFEHLPVVVLTSSSDAPTKLKALEMGATDFLAKPVDESELVLRVRNTLAAKAYQDRLANTDRLTGLPNRHVLVDRLEWAIKQAERNGQSGALMLLNIHRFRQLNEALGPAMADELLLRVAQRLEIATRDSDLLAVLPQSDKNQGLARLGGDEFALLLHGELSPETIARIARRLLRALAEPFHLQQQELYLALNIGIAIFPDDGTDSNEVQRNAGIAIRSLESEQANPEGAFCFYSKELNARTISGLGLENELRRALERNELEVFYQPKYDVVSEEVVGAECLLRWKHPQRGYVSPVEFIPVAEETGLIIDIGQYVLEEACRKIAQWDAQGLKPGTLAVNASVQQFRHHSFRGAVRNALATSGITPAHLKIEVTESLLMTQHDQATAMLGDLRALGVQLSIDDFGTGYSSLSYLRSMPIDELKIDRSFLTDVESSKDSAAIVRAILAMAHSLDLVVVAEGVETQGQLAFLREHRCDTLQGFLFSRPLPAQDFEDLLRARLGA
ncbi:MAG: GGDEF domain-containing response regulator [Betaproteobacteria bacterium HGW-Betaproteobacteria-13]|jgi:diguanylate cyclase (GGDEF)-like protein|nr:MAG: GGDEF domain-containing response regulator [Betaproteobacteria bacterium HGW-Betaproteobacteria-13]